MENKENFNHDGWYGMSEAEYKKIAKENAKKVQTDLDALRTLKGAVKINPLQELDDKTNNA